MIIFIEDIEAVKNSFLPTLEKYDEVKHFSNQRDLMVFLKGLEEEGNFEDIKCVVCDHNYYPFADSRDVMGLGTSTYLELKWSDYSETFVHFSADPCPDKYEANDDDKFYSIKKKTSEIESFTALEEVLKKVYNK